MGEGGKRKRRVRIERRYREMEGRRWGVDRCRDGGGGLFFYGDGKESFYMHNAFLNMYSRALEK